MLTYNVHEMLINKCRKFAAAVWVCEILEIVFFTQNCLSYQLPIIYQLYRNLLACAEPCKLDCP